MLPQFNERGDLPPGVHRAQWSEIADRFGSGEVRQMLTRTLLHIHHLATRTGHLERFVIFGSYVTAKEEPGDVDVMLVMDAGFLLDQSPQDSWPLFSHADADARFGASVFWARQGILADEEIAGLLDFWQTRRDGLKRGIVEITS